MSEPGSRRHLADGEYYGQIVGHQESSGLCMSEVRHTRGARLPYHTHESAYFCLVLDGGYREQLGRNERTYGPFSVAFYPAALPHRVEICQTGARFFNCEVGADWIEALADVDTQAKLGRSPVQDGRAFGSLLQLYSEFADARRGGYPVDRLTFESLAAAVVSSCLDFRVAAERSRPRWLLTAMEYIDAHYTCPISVGDLAASAGVHRVYLARVFRRAQGCTVAQYRNALRVRQACALLRVRDIPLSQIAMDTGFADQSHFTRVFAAMIGRSPGAFRRMAFPEFRTVRDHAATLCG